MKIHIPVLFAVSASLFYFTSCSQQELEYSAESKQVLISVPEGSLSAGDDIMVFNDVNNAGRVLSLSLTDKDAVVVPNAAKTLYTVCRVCGGLKDACIVEIPAEQVLDKAERMYDNSPSLSISTIEKGKTLLSFRPLAATVVLRLYHPKARPEEMIESVLVSPAQENYVGTSSISLSEGVYITEGNESGPVSVIAKTPIALPTSPSDAKSLSLCLARKKYNLVEFFVKTTSAEYTVKTGDSYIDCLDNETAVLDINLADGTAKCYYDISNEPFEETYPCPPLTPLDMDFSRVGYHFGENDFPVYNSNVVYLEPEGNAPDPADDEIIDRLADIQEAIASVKTPGTVVLKAGRYYVSNQIRVGRSNVILRGEVASAADSPKSRNLTTLIATRQDEACATEKPRFIILGQNPKEPTLLSGSEVVGNYLPEGCMYVRVANPDMFKAGDRVILHRPDSRDWSHDLGMDNIVSKDGSEIYSWYDYDGVYDIDAERIVTSVKDDKIYLDNPVPMSIDPSYGRGTLYHCSVNRIRESGIEYLNIDTFYNPEITSTSRQFVEGKLPEYCSDEMHSWDAIRVSGAEHCWVKGVTSTHFAYSCVSLYGYSKNITVEDCHCYEPISIVTSPRRYAFSIGAAQLCLVKDCSCEKDRHQFVTTGHTSIGPHVFLNCKATGSYSNAGPHSHWATFVLYDNLVTDEMLSVEDLQYSGFSSGAQGWQGANHVFWNCEAASLVCQSPQVSARNWCYGCKGEKLWGSMDRTCNEGDRPDGNWAFHNQTATPVSLYSYQLSQRIKEGELLAPTYLQ